jgi:hypothetical protein
LILVGIVSVVKIVRGDHVLAAQSCTFVRRWPSDAPFNIIPNLHEMPRNVSFIQLLFLLFLLF